MNKFSNLHARKANLLLLSIFISFFLSAQTTVVINTGSPGTPSYNAGPVYRSSGASGTDASRYCYLYTQSELAAVGIIPGSVITALGWTKNNGTSANGPADFSIYMKSSTATAFTSTTETWSNLNSGAMLVYQSSTFVMPATQAPNYISFPLSSPFAYNGGSIEVCTEWDISSVTGTATTGTFQWLWSTVPDRIYGDGSTSLSGTATLSSISNSISTIDDRRPFIQIEFTPPPPCTVPPTAGNATASITTAFCPGIAVALSLSGNSIGSGQTYQWESSPNIAGPYTTIGNPSLSPDTIIAASATLYYRAAVTCAANTQYSSPVQVNVLSGLSGTFTIDASQPTGGTNFTSFTDALSALNCGLIGPVVINVVPSSGPYQEQIQIPEISGMSAINTLTINGNGNTLSYSGTATTSRYIIELDGADHVIIDSLNIDASLGTYGWGVHLTNDADSNVISNCTITTSTTSTSSTNFAGILLNDDNNGILTTGQPLSDYNTFTGNTIIGGYAGIAVIADGDGFASMVSSNVITNNTVEDFYLYGIYLNGGENTLIEGNDFSRPNRTSVSTFNGIYMRESSVGTIVSKNTFHDPFESDPTPTSAAFSIYLYECFATAGMENVITNNVVYNMLYNTGNQNGILCRESDYARFYHNSITLDDSLATCSGCDSRGIYFQDLSNSIAFYNNIINIARGGFNQKQCVYVEDPASTIIWDRNVYYISPASGGLREIGSIAGTGYETLAQWQAITLQDSNSVNEIPGFVNARNGDLTPMSVAMDDIGEPGLVVDDILGNTRSGTPDPGAFEFTGIPCGIGSVPIVSNIGVISTDISWNAVPGASAYEYQVSTVDTAQGASILTTSTSISVSDLFPSTQYYVHLRADCGFGGYSDWETTPFITGYCQPPVPTFNIVSDQVVTVNWAPVNDADEYEYHISTDDVSPASGTRTTNNSVNAVNLSPDSVYYAHLRSLCGSGFSAWSVTGFKSTTTSINELDRTRVNISVYPNPVRNELNVVLSEGADLSNAQLKVYSITGKIMKTLRINERNAMIDMSDLAEGIYLLEFTSDAQNKTVRILKQ